MKKFFHINITAIEYKYFKKEHNKAEQYALDL